jgi:hypothetical protein
MERAVEHAAHAAELAHGGDPQLLAWTLAHCAVMESYVPVKPGSIEPSNFADLRSHAESHSEEALRVGRSVPGSIAQQYPLLAVAACAMAEGGGFTWSRSGPEIARGVAAAEEVAAIDRTQRRFWSTTVGSTVANALAMRGAGADELVQWRAILRNHHEHHEPFMFVLLLGNVSESLVDVEPAIAVELAAIAESGAIAPTATFTLFPNLIRRATDDPEMAADARNRAARMTRDEAYERVLSSLDDVIARRGMA